MTTDQLPCPLCGDDEEVEIVCTVPGAPQIGTVTSPCPDCLPHEKDAEIVDVRREEARRVINRNRWSDAIKAERDRLRAENVNLRRKCVEQEILWTEMVVENAKLREALRDALAIPTSVDEWDTTKNRLQKLLDETETNDARMRTVYRNERG